MSDDMPPGTSLVDGSGLFFQCEDTRRITVIGATGGEAELNVAQMIREYKRTSKSQGRPPLW